MGSDDCERDYLIEYLDEIMVTAAWSCEKQQRTKLKEMTATCMWRFLYVKNQQKQNFQYLSVFIVSVNIVQFSILTI